MIYESGISVFCVGMDPEDRPPEPAMDIIDAKSLICVEEEVVC